MTAAQMVGYSLNQASAITAIVSNRIYHGFRPIASIVPCINYFEVSGGKRQNGFERIVYSINCRAVTAATALQVARLVTDLFHGTSGTGIWGDANGFAIGRASLVQQQGLIPEVADNLYNAPVDFEFVYPSSTVS